MAGPHVFGPLGKLAGCLVLAALVTGACSGGDGEEASATVRPCEVVKKSEVEVAVGSTVGDGTAPIGVPSLLVGEQVCQYSIGGAQGIPGLVKVGVASAYAPIVFGRYKAAHPQASPLPRVGNEAVWDDTAQTLVVLDGEKALTVTVFGGGLADPKERATKLAQKALPRL